MTSQDLHNRHVIITGLAQHPIHGVAKWQSAGDNPDRNWAVYIPGPAHSNGWDSGFLCYCPPESLTVLDLPPHQWPVVMTVKDRQRCPHCPNDGDTVNLTHPLPTFGRIVHYRGKMGLQAPRCAIVTADIDSLDPAGVESGEVPALSSPEHVHLWVFTPGERGGFAEYDVPRGDAPDGVAATAKTIPPGTWCWPPRV